MQPSLSKVLVAEAIGTFTLTFIGVLAASVALLVGAPPGMVTLTTVAFAHGLAIAVMVAALGHISGGHFNPAITFGFVVSGRMKPLQGLYYWIAQVAGAIIAALILLPIIGQGGSPREPRCWSRGSGGSQGRCSSWSGPSSWSTSSSAR